MSRKGGLGEWMKGKPLGYYTLSKGARRQLCLVPTHPMMAPREQPIRDCRLDQRKLQLWEIRLGWGCRSIRTEDVSSCCLCTKVTVTSDPGQDLTVAHTPGVPDSAPVFQMWSLPRQVGEGQRTATECFPGLSFLHHCSLVWTSLRERVIYISSISPF